MKTLAELTKQQSLEDFLKEEMDEIYYPGYSEEIIASDPEKFNWELAEFEAQFE